MLEHGYFKIEVIDQILIVRCFESWNIETVIKMCQEFKKHAEEINDKPWACLVDLSQWELSCPQMWDEIEKLNRWSNENQQKYEAVVCTMSIQQTLMKASQTELTNVESQFFEDIEHAFHWLDSVGFIKTP